MKTISLEIDERVYPQIVNFLRLLPENCCRVLEDDFSDFSPQEISAIQAIRSRLKAGDDSDFSDFQAIPQPYLIETFWSEEDQAFLCIAPDLPGCSAAGTTPLEAIREMQDAMDSWLQACANLGRPAPEPKAKPRMAA